MQTFIKSSSLALAPLGILATGGAAMFLVIAKDATPKYTVISGIMWVTVGSAVGFTALCIYSLFRSHRSVDRTGMTIYALIVTIVYFHVSAALPGAISDFAQTKLAAANLDRSILFFTHGAWIFSIFFFFSLMNHFLKKYGLNTDGPKTN